MRLFRWLFLAWLPVLPAFAQIPPSEEGLEYSVGSSVLVYQSVYSLDESLSIDGAIRGPISSSWYWQAGARLGLGDARPEAFAQILLTQRFGGWHPSVGLECGLSTRTRFGDGDLLLRESRKAMEGDISPAYLAVQSSPLVFDLWGTWRASLLEIHVGTHVSHFGRTMRLQLGLLSIGARL